MRLIDADELKRKMDVLLDDEWLGLTEYDAVTNAIANTPTVDAVSRAEAIDVVCDKCPISFKEKCEWRDNGHCSMKVALESLGEKTEV